MSSPILARAVFRAASRTTGTRAFSMAQSLRSTHAPADYGKMVKRVWGNAIVNVPVISLGLGWPLIAYAICDGHVV